MQQVANPQCNGNRLGKSNSPYLLQHAFNPVDWHEWGPEALQLAAQQNRLIFLSIGYSTCHWCHVMERESFEDDEVAALLNSAFVSIKVDREQRPDIDHIYMDVCQALTGSGGWPLTLILTPAQEPVFAGTYFSKRQKHGRPGLMEILAAVQAAWIKEPQKLIDSAQEVSGYFKNRRSGAIRFPEQKLVNHAIEDLSKDYDPLYGGFSVAPKFPMGHVLELLLNHANTNDNTRLLAQVEHTLVAMYQGGIFDHVGGGFCRYSTDEKWLVPHFEKMLYDNALLLRVYCEAYGLTKKPLYRSIVEEICTYLSRDLRDDAGGFYSAQDADSEGHEGKFYVFSHHEFMNLAGSQMGEQLAAFFGVSVTGNFEAQQNILNINHLPDEFCKKNSLEPEALATAVKELKKKLFAYRARRISPALDDKVITSWNGLAIGALAMAGRTLMRADLIELAQQAAGFVAAELTGADGSLYRCWRHGKAEFNGYFEDYALLIHGLLELYRADFNLKWLQWCCRLQSRAVELFAGREPGVYFETPEDGEKLLFRPQNSFDGALPSARAVFADSCVTLAAITGNNAYTDMATAIFAESADLIYRAPSATAVMTNALRRFYSCPVRITINTENLADAEQLLAVITERQLPDVYTIICANDNDRDIYRQLSGDRDLLSESRFPVVHICGKDGCQAPVYDVAELKQRLTAIKAAPPLDPQEKKQ